MRTIFLLGATFTAALGFVAACDNELEPGCLSGPCNAEAQSSASSGAGASPTGGGNDPGGGGPGGEGGGEPCVDNFPAEGDIPCDVWQVLHDRCHCCHQDPPLNFAPFPLLTYEETRAIYSMMSGKLRWERMSEVVQDTGIPHMPLTGQAKDLSSSQKKVLDDWFAACAPPADQYQDGGPGCDESEPPPTMCNPP